VSKDQLKKIMAEDQVNDDILNDKVENTSSEEQSDTANTEETTVEEKKVSLEDVLSVVKGLQKGYTQTRQDISAVREAISNASVNKDGNKPEEGEDEYVTVKSLKKVLHDLELNKNQAQEQQKLQAEAYIDSTMTDLEAQGVINSEQDRNDLMAYAVKIEEPDLLKASRSWLEVKAVKAANKSKEDEDKTKERRKDASTIGDSSKTGGEPKGVKYSDIKKMDW